MPSRRDARTARKLAKEETKRETAKAKAEAKEAKYQYKAEAKEAKTAAKTSKSEAKAEVKEAKIAAKTERLEEGVGLGANLGKAFSAVGGRIKHPLGNLPLYALIGSGIAVTGLVLFTKAGGITQTSQLVRSVPIVPV